MSALSAVYRALLTVPPPVAAFVWGMLARLWVIWLFPANYSFDAYQRWAGRDHVLVQGWLPATQSLVWAVAQLGGGLTTLFIVFSVVGALAHAAGTQVAQWLGGRSAAWAFVAFGAMGPFVAWSRVPYQEATFLLFLFGGLAAAGSGRLLLADLLVGAVGLVRYEGWAFLPLYVLWRRSPVALRAGWGVAVWLLLYAGLGLRGYAASPVDFDDWEGLSERFHVGRWADDVGGFAEQAWAAGLVPVALASVWGGVVLWRTRRDDALLLGGMLAAQLGITLVWIAGLETPTYRMEAIPGMLVGLGAAVAVADLYDGVSDVRVRRGLQIAVAFLACTQVDESARQARMSVSMVAPERALIREIRSRPGTVWWIEPRADLGTRQRHDSCEALQGLLDDFRHGRDFWCEGWLTPEQIVTHRPTCTGWIRWTDGAYEVFPTWPAPPETVPIRVSARVSGGGGESAEEEEPARPQ